MTLYQTLIQPFSDDAMRRALVACVALSFSGAPLGVFLVLRRMTLMGDAMSHGILSGVALAFVLFGTSIWPMMAGGLIAGLLIAGISGAVTRLTPLKEDASLAGIYLVSLALAVVILSGDTEELEAVLFGDIFKITVATLQVVIAITSFSLVTFAVFYRALITECFDPVFLRSVKGRGAMHHICFLILVVINLVAAFQAMGMLMALGLITLPAIAAQLWSKNIDRIMLIAIGFTLVSSVSGLLITYHAHLPSGPAIVLVAGGIYAFSVLFGRSGGIITSRLPHRHFVE